MQQLRWTLLVLGALFIALLAWWERRSARSRQDAGAGHDREGYREAGAAATRAAAPARHAPSGLGADLPLDAQDARDPPLTLPPPRGREPLRAPMVIDMPGEEPVSPLETGTLRSGAQDQVDAGRESPMTATAPDVLRATPLSADSADAQFVGAVAGAVIPTLAPVHARTALAGGATIREEPTLPPRPTPRVEWPAERERRIVAARLVATGERFSGRALRLAFAAEGLEHGPMGIFHRVLDDGRVSWSAASLTKPGSFDLTSMDSVHFAGLHLFAVLPGALPEGEVSGDLTTTARRLAERLGGELRDEGGRPLDLLRVSAPTAGGRA
jgi:hypothetical protein